MILNSLRVFLWKQKQKILLTQELKYPVEQFDGLIYTGLAANDGTSDYHIPHVWVHGWTGLYCKYCNQKISKEKESSQCGDNKEPETLSARLSNYQRRHAPMDLMQMLKKLLAYFICTDLCKFYKLFKKMISIVLVIDNMQYAIKVEKKQSSNATLEDVRKASGDLMVDRYCTNY
jgi:hypothetical protein